MTREQFDRLKPASQGFVSYMQAAWNKEIPNKPIYEKGTKEFDQWCERANRAMFSCLDGDDE